MATASEKRLMVRNKYRTIIGRNIYSQNLRDFCYKPYKDGKNYSDCSSSICHTYREVGLGFGILNTVGMWNSTKLVDVPVIIKKGIVQNPDVLRIGDMLLFAGNDNGRKSWGYVGHVEMVGEISGGTVWLYGHGSGNPKRHGMNAYCRTRYNTKSSTPLGHRGLIRVRRLIQDDAPAPVKPTEDVKPVVETSLGQRILRNGCVGEDVKELQTALIQLGYSCGSWGADGDFGDNTEQAVRQFQRANNCDVDGEVGQQTLAALKTATTATVEQPSMARIVGGNCYVREVPDTTSKILGVVYEGTVLDWLGEASDDGWLLVNYNGQKGWVSGKYGRLIA